jgi:hypothetical protein
VGSQPPDARPRTGRVMRAHTTQESPGGGVARAPRHAVGLNYSTEAASCKPSSEAPTLSSTLDGCAWWRAESERIGTDWRGLISLHFQICNRLQAASSLWCSS